MRLHVRLWPLVVATVLLAVTSCGGAPPAAATRRDVVVYGGTPAGVAAAVAAARQGSSVTLLAEQQTVGGMMSNGLGATDIGSAVAVQGLAVEFFDKIRAVYGDPAGWRFEPHVAERVFRGMLGAAHVDVRYDAHLATVEVADRKIRCIDVSGGARFCATTFIDATYTGDLVAAARIPYRLGMKDLYAYGETLADKRDWRRVAALPPDQVAAGTSAFRRNPFVTSANSLPPYRSAAAKGMPSLTYRLCVTPDARNRTPFKPTSDYSAWVASFRYLTRGASPTVTRKSNGTLSSDYYQLAALPAGKYDLNSGSAGLTDVPAPADYFSGAAARRRDDASLQNYVESFFYFVQHDPSVPPSVQQPLEAFGLCADEFTDHGNWPYEPYVREGRRISGRYTFTQKDLYVEREKANAVALGSYDVDGKSTQMLYVDGAVYRDVGVHETVPVYEIPYDVMVPRAGSVVNLLAPIGLSSSPTAYGSLRVEPQYMELGQAAGVAAAVAARIARPVATVPASRIQAVLRSTGVTFKIRELCAQTAAEWRAAGGFSAGCDVLPVNPAPVP